MNKLLEVPFDNKGNMKITNPRGPNVIRQFVGPFEATLRIKELDYGMTATRLVLIDTNGCEWSMFQSEWHRLFLDGRFVGRTVIGTWYVRKMGAHYGLMELREND